MHNEQAMLWNGPAGHAWVDTQELLDYMLEPFEELLLAGIAAGSERRILDIGCGTGATTLAAARRLGARGQCVGIDISAPMLATARLRAGREGAPAQFIQADAQTYPFDVASFDGLISRFGVMFFDDPVTAFANLRRAAKPGAPLRFIAWRSPAENPFMITAERVAAPLLPNLPPRQPGAPGQFAFAERSRIQAILEGSGWSEIDIQPIDVTCTLPEAELSRYLTRLGPVGLALQEANEQTRVRVVEALRTAFAPYVEGTEARFTAACWLACAQAPAA